MSATTNANGLHLRRGPSGERGVVLLAVVTVALVVSVAAGSYLALAGFAVKGVETWREQDQCLLAALSAMEEVKADSHRAFNTYFEALPLSHTVAKFDWFDSWTATTLGADGAYTLPQSADRDGASVSAEVVDVSAPAVHRRVVTFGLTASLGSSQRRILESVSYQLGPSRIFGYGYFVNNSAWLGGAGVTIMGDVRANGNVYCIDSPTINGHVIGGVNPELGTLGIVDGSWSFESLADYYLSAAVQARPGNPPSPGYVGDWELGYDGAPRGFEGLPKLRMPDLEDLGDYEAMALSVGSHIDQGGVRLVDGVYDGPGPDGLAGTCDDGVLVLVGTAADPIEINGPIVTRGDVLIKGYVTGQGTIYSERNIHIVDNVEYVNPPAWIKPDPTPELTAQANESADFLGLAAKGNIIMGDPTTPSWNSACQGLLRPPYTQEYTTKRSEYPIGYDSDWNKANGHLFNGDYTGDDGGYRIDPSGKEHKRYYYQFTNEQAMVAVGTSNTLTRIDAALYTDHLMGGKTGELVINGAVVSRDEVINYDNTIQINWDIRLGGGIGGVETYLPRDLHEPVCVYWREVDL